jgi:hypothetical protein
VYEPFCQPVAAFRFEGAATLAMISPNGPAFFADPRSFPVVALSGGFGNTSSHPGGVERGEMILWQLAEVRVRSGNDRADVSQRGEGNVGPP